MEAATGSTIRLWDLPVRLVHWAFALLLPALWWTGENGQLELHRKAGYAMLALVVFRVVWGFVGSATARFAGFVKGPGTIAAYLRGALNRPILGHNPVGALSVILLLGLLGAQITAGLFAQDVDGLESGPLTYLVSYDTADAARGIHHLLFNVIFGVVALHVAAIAYYLFAKRDNLVGPMVTGRKQVAQGVAEPATAPLWRAAAIGLASAAFAWWISAGAPVG